MIILSVLLSALELAL